jgi:hypothetical protein
MKENTITKGKWQGKSLKSKNLDIFSEMYDIIVKERLVVLNKNKEELYEIFSAMDWRTLSSSRCPCCFVCRRGNISGGPGGKAAHAAAGPVGIGRGD